MLFSTHASHVSLLYSVCIYKYIEFIFCEFYMKKQPEPQWLQYFKLVFLKIQNVPLRTVFANPVTYTV